MHGDTCNHLLIRINLVTLTAIPMTIKDVLDICLDVPTTATLCKHPLVISWIQADLYLVAVIVLKSARIIVVSTWYSMDVW